MEKKIWVVDFETIVEPVGIPGPVNRSPMDADTQFADEFIENIDDVLTVLPYPAPVLAMVDSEHENIEEPTLEYCLNCM